MNATTHKVIAVCIGEPTPIATKSGMTGIYKKPAAGPVKVTDTGLSGDAICDTKNHGGPNKAVYIYGSVDLDWWNEELGFKLEPGTLGENLVVEGLASENIHVGDRLTSTGLELEVTYPRIPCVTLAARMGDKKFGRKFMQARRPGFYCKVIQPGMIETGASLALSKGNQERSVLELFDKPA